MWTEICEVRQIFKGDLTKFCEIFTKINLELHQNSQKPLFKCKKLVINTTKCDLYLFLHKMYGKMVWKFCEIWKILYELASIWAKFWHFISQCEIWHVCKVTSDSWSHVFLYRIQLIEWNDHFYLFIIILFIYFQILWPCTEFQFFTWIQIAKTEDKKKKKKSIFSVIIWIYHNILNFQTNGPGQTV